MSENTPGADAQVQPARRRRSCLLWAAVVVGALVLLLCLLAGWLWAAGSKAKVDLVAAYPPPGQMVDLGGYRLHIHCVGPGPGEAGPTVVIEAGLGEFSVNWDQVQKQVGEFARICTYDRPGMGWSDVSPKARSGTNAVEELHTLLTRAGVEPPYVLVGHSLGGLYVRLYAYEYPDEVAGLVLVDPAYEEEDARQPATFLQAQERFSKQMVSVLRIPQLLSAVGVLAQSADDYPEGVLPPLPPGTEETYKAVLAMDDSYFRTVGEEYRSLEGTLDLLRATGDTGLGDMPLVVLTAGRFVVPEGYGVPAEDREQVMAVRREVQAELAALSSSGVQVVLEDSGHSVYLDEPESVVDAIRQVVDAAQP